jgi:hypothetical protein
MINKIAFIKIKTTTSKKKTTTQKTKRNLAMK